MFQRNNNGPVDYPDDCIRIKKIALSLGYDVTLYDAEELWHVFSETEYCAGWLILPEQDDEIIRAIRWYFSND